MKNKDVRKLIQLYGSEITLQEILKNQGKEFICPKCQGNGTEKKLVRQGVWGYTDDEYKLIDCDICGGHGYTQREIKPKYKTELIGYE